MSIRGPPIGGIDKQVKHGIIKQVRAMDYHTP